MIFYGAFRSSAEYVADASDPDTASRRIEDMISLVLAGLRDLGTRAAQS